MTHEEAYTLLIAAAEHDGHSTFNAEDYRAIAEMVKPVEDDEIAEAIGQLETAALVLPASERWAEAEWCKAAADLMERLAREKNHQSDNASGLFDECKRLQSELTATEDALRAVIKFEYGTGRYYEQMVTAVIPEHRDRINRLIGENK